MSKLSCVMIPKASNGKDSKLFEDLLSITGDRKTSLFMWGLSQDSLYMDKLKNIEYDENGEPLAVDIIDSIGKNTNRIGYQRPKDFLSRKGYLNYITRKENLTSTSYDDYFEAVNKALELRNKYFEEFTVSVKGNEYKVGVHEDSEYTREAVRKMVKTNELHIKMLNFLRKLGFDFKVDGKLKANGKMSPVDAETNAEGLKTVIQIAKGKRGYDALPEEFAHLFLEGLHNHHIVERYMNTLDDNLVKEILGDSFDTYNELYKGNKELLKKEAAGKLLAQTILDRAGVKVNTFLPDKIWDVIFGKFQNTDVNDVDLLIYEAALQANEVSNIFETPEVYEQEVIESFDRGFLVDGPTLYQAETKVNQAEKIAEKAYQLLNKKFKIMSSKYSKKKLTESEYKILQKMKSDLEKKKYASSSIAFLKYALTDVKGLNERMLVIKEKMAEDPIMDNKALKYVFRLLREIKTNVEAYSSVIREMSLLSQKEGILDELDERDIEDIENLAEEVEKVYKHLTKSYDELRFDSLFKFYQRYWGNDKIIKTSDGTDKYLKLEDILKFALGDISSFSRLVNSMSDLDDPLLGLVDVVMRKTNESRDTKIFEYSQEVGTILKEYMDKTGSRDTSFMYVFDEKGIPTGSIISDIDYSKYYAERREYIMSLKDQKVDKDVLKAKLQIWEGKHTVKVALNNGRTEIRPKKELYPSNDYNNLTDAQKEYYNKMMAIKEEMDGLIPSRYTQTHKAIQKRKDTGEALADNVTTPGKAIKQVYQRMKGNFVRNIDDTEYGEIINEDGSVGDIEQRKQILLDFSGNPVKKLPVFYTSRLHDMSLLSTDFSDSMIAYISMAENYHQLSQVADALEVTKELVADRDVKQKQGASKLFEGFKFNGEYFTSDYVKKGINSQIYTKLSNYLDSNMYNIRKVHETFSIGDKEYNYGKAGDAIKWYSSLLGLGYNTFSGISNATMGINQMIIEAAGGDNFGYKNLAVGHKNYMKYIAGCIADQYQDVKSNKLTLVLQKFDALEDFYREAANSDMNKGLFRRLIGKFNPLFMNSLGEHYLHGVTLLAYLDNQKVKLNGEEISLFEAFEVKEVTDTRGFKTPKLVLKEGVTNLDGNPITDDDILKIKNKSQVISHSLHGAFGDIDKGDAQRTVLGRLLLQYRQWMPAFYTRRFGGSRYNVISEDEIEGFYVTSFKFITGVLKDLTQAKFSFFTRWKNMNKAEKANLWRATLETSLFGILSLILGSRGTPDDDDKMVNKMLLYAMYRLKAELGAATPYSTEFYSNIKTLYKSPVPAMEGTDRLISLLNIYNMTVEIESGKYQGWSKWERDAYYAVPFIRNISRVKDLYDGEYTMFNAYIN